MNASDSTNGAGPLKNRSIMQHVCELIPTVPLFPSDTNSTTGPGQDAAVVPSNMVYVSHPPSGATSSGYAPPPISTVPCPGSGYASHTNAYAPSANVGYPGSDNVVYPSPNAFTTSGTVPHDKYVSPTSVQYQSNIDLSSGGAGRGTTGYYSTSPSRPPELNNSRSWRP